MKQELGTTAASRFFMIAKICMHDTRGWEFREKIFRLEV